MSKKTLIASAVGSAFVASMASAPLASAAENPFALSGLSGGYQVADNHVEKPAAKPMEGKCGGMKADDDKGGMAMMDANKDGKVSKEEFIKGHETMFGMMDANKDGFLDKTEMSKMIQGKSGEGKCGGAMNPMEGKSGGMK